MTPYTSTLGATVAINARLFSATALGWLAFVIWPDAVEWWGMGLASIACGYASLVAVIGAVRLMVQVYQREKAVREFLAQGPAPKSSEMASNADLERAGMR